MNKTLLFTGTIILGIESLGVLAFMFLANPLIVLKIITLIGISCLTLLGFICVLAGIFN